MDPQRHVHSFPVARALLAITCIAVPILAGLSAESPRANRAAAAPTLSLNPTRYAAGGYSTIAWKGAPPCTASASPEYEPWSGTKAADWAQSVAPAVSTVFTISCNGVASSVTLTVEGAPDAAPSPAPESSAAAAPADAGVTAPDAPLPTGSGSYRSPAYSPPANRPFISLHEYESVNRRSGAYTRFRDMVDDAVAVTARLPQRTPYDQIVEALNSTNYGYSSADAVILYRLTGDSKYIDHAIRIVDAFVAAENARIAAGTQPRIAGDSYLEVGFFMEQVALVYDYGFGRLTEAQRALWSAYSEQAIWNVWNPTRARWGNTQRAWSGWSVNDPGNNYFYSFLKATQLWALASQNGTWLTHLKSRSFPLLTGYFSNLPGGGTREGTGYGTALGSLFENYAYWKSSTGEDLAAHSPHAADTIDYWIHATVPTFDYFASIGDQSRSSMPMMFDYQRKLVAQAVALDPASPQARRGTWWLNRVKVTDGGGGWLTGRMRYSYDLRYDLLEKSKSEEAPGATLHDAAGAGVVFARSDWGPSASWMHLVAGQYDQSHAHQDQGSFSFFRNGWLSITANTTSNSGINQDVGVHNVIRFEQNGAVIPQRYSTSRKSLSDNGDALKVQEDLTAAYAGSAGRVKLWKRELTYTRSSHSIAIADTCETAPGVKAVWQLQLPSEPIRQRDGSLLAGRLRIVPMQPASPSVAVVNMRSLSREFTGGYRLELSGPDGSCEFRALLQAQ
jgi:hypothetical protein